jgi:HAD superfamily hydrolase (TIGR01549 family)
MNPDLVIFDLDGVIINSTYNDFQWAAKVRKELADEKGWDMDWEGFEQTVFSVHHNENFNKQRKKKNVSWDQIREMEKAVVSRKLEMVEEGEIKLFNDVEETLEALNQDIAVVSNAYGDYLPELFSRLGIIDLIDYVRGPEIEDIENYREKMKPSPTMIEKIIQQSGAERPVMVGDQIEDILAAERAGITSIYLGRDGTTESKADYNISGLGELQTKIN